MFQPIWICSDRVLFLFICYDCLHHEPAILHVLYVPFNHICRCPSSSVYSNNPQWCLWALPRFDVRLLNEMRGPNWFSDIGSYMLTISCREIPILIWNDPGSPVTPLLDGDDGKSYLGSSSKSRHSSQSLSAVASSSRSNLDPRKLCVLSIHTLVLF